MIMDYFRLGKIGAVAHWKKVNGPINEHIKRHHKNYLMEKARVIGFIMGDGCVTKLDRSPDRQHHDIRFYPDHISLVRIFLKDFKKLYLKEPRVKNLGKYFSVCVSSKPACDDLRSIGNFDSLGWSMPKFTSKEEEIEWLRAIFDCEAYVGKKDLRIQSVSKKGIESIKNLLEHFRIQPRVYIYDRKNKNWNRNYILVIAKKKDIKRYQDLIGFNHNLKQKKLNKFAGVPERLMGRSRKSLSERTSRFES